MWQKCLPVTSRRLFAVQEGCAQTPRASKALPDTTSERHFQSAWPPFHYPQNFVSVRTPGKDSLPPPQRYWGPTLIVKSYAASQWWNLLYKVPNAATNAVQVPHTVVGWRSTNCSKLQVWAKHGRMGKDQGMSEWEGWHVVLDVSSLEFVDTSTFSPWFYAS